MGLFCCFLFGGEFRQIVQHHPRRAEIIIPEKQTAGDEHRNVGPRGRDQPVGGILDRDAVRGFKLQLRQDLEIHVRRRLLVPDIIAGDDRVEVRSPAFPERARQQRIDVAV